jgi:4-hydroxy-2-oxoheptanedioate aldolase
MKTNTAKEAMLKGKPAFGYSLGLGSPANAELLSNCGIDFLLLDRQHGSWEEESTIAALVAMARVARNDYTMIGRLLDEGVLGIGFQFLTAGSDAGFLQNGAAAGIKLLKG